MQIEDSEKLKVWLTAALEPLCDADPPALAKYVLALIKKDKPDTDLKESLRKQMDVFLQTQTDSFVEKLFQTLDSKDYLNDVTDAATVGAENEPEIANKGDDAPLEEKQPDSTTPKDEHRHERRHIEIDDHRSRSGRRSSRDRDRRSPRRRHPRRLRSRSRSPYGVRRGSSPYSRRRRSSLSRRSRSRSHSPRRHSPARRLSPSKRDEDAIGYVPSGRQRCRDYDEKGFCMRGDQCKFDHGTDAVVIEDSAVPAYNPAEPGVIPKTDTSIPPPGYSEPYVPAPTFNVPPPGYPAGERRKRSYEGEGGPPSKRGFGGRGRGGRGRGASMGGNSGRGSTQLAVRNIPPTLNNIGLLNNHFGKFGNLVNVQVHFEGDPASALISYSNSGEAESAMNSAEAVLANRFIRVFYYYEKPNVHDRLGGATGATEVEGKSAEETSLEVQKQKEEEKAAAIAAIKKNQEVLQTKAQMKKNAESKKVESISKLKELCKSKQDLLEKQMSEQKKLIGKIEERKGSMKAEERTAIMKLIKTLSDSITKTRDDLQKLVQMSANKKTASDIQKELLDAELELFTAQQDGLDATEIQKRVNALSIEAAKQGILPTSRSPGARGGHAASRGAGRGFFSPRGRFYGRGGYRGRGGRGGGGFGGGFSTTVDRRPSKLKITGFDPDDKEAVIAHFKRFGEILDTMDEEDAITAETGGLVIHFKTRRDAEMAMAGGKSFGEQHMQMAWYTGVTPIDLQSQLSTEEVNASDTTSEAHEDDDYTPLDPTYLPPGLEDDQKEEKNDKETAEDDLNEEEINEDLLEEEEEEEEDDEGERSWKRE